MFIIGLIITQRMTPTKNRKVKFQIFKIAQVCTTLWSVTGWPIIIMANNILQTNLGVTHIKAKNQHFAKLVKF